MYKLYTNVLCLLAQRGYHRVSTFAATWPEHSHAMAKKHSKKDIFWRRIPIDGTRVSRTLCLHQILIQYQLLPHQTAETYIIFSHNGHPLQQKKI